MQPPHPSIGKPDGEKRRTLTDEGLEDRVAALEESEPGEIHRAQARAVAIHAAVQEARTTGDVEAVRADLTATAAAVVEGQVWRYAAHGLQRHRTDVTVQQVEPARITEDGSGTILVVRLQGTLKDLVYDTAGTLVGEQTLDPYRFSEYVTLYRPEGGAWLLHQIDDDLVFTL